MSQNVIYEVIFNLKEDVKAFEYYIVTGLVACKLLFHAVL